MPGREPISNLKPIDGKLFRVLIAETIGTGVK
jgi:hypothetical protein